MLTVRPSYIKLFQPCYRCLSTFKEVYQRVGSDQSMRYLLTDSKTLKVSLDDHRLGKDWPYYGFQILLPKGYPTTVEPGYLNYIQWQAISSISGTVCGCLSMQSLLYAAGIGAEMSLPLAATMNWIIKDGLGQMGGILFASLVNNKFDTNPKYYRMLASISMELASFIELLLPLAPQYFLVGASIANIGKNIAFLASSASRAAIHKSFASHGNLADITAKSGSQGILCSLLGTSIGISLAAFNQNAYLYTCLSFVSCALISIFACYLSLKSVTLTSLTTTVLDHIFYHMVVVENSKAFSDRIVLSPLDIRNKEQFLSLKPLPFRYSLSVNSDLPKAFEDTSHLKSTLEDFIDTNYILSIFNEEVHLIFKESANKMDILLGMLHSFLIRHALQSDTLPLSDVILTTKKDLPKCK